MNHSKFGRYYEDLEKGEVIHHALSKTIFESDNNLFSLLTMNHHPVHINLDYATRNQHGKILVVGTLVLSLVVGMTVPEISGNAIANLGYEEIRHLFPVFINDTLYAKSTVLDKVPSRTKSDRGIVVVSTVAYNQDGHNVLELKRKVMLKKKDAK